MSAVFAKIEPSDFCRPYSRKRGISPFIIQLSFTIQYPEFGCEDWKGGNTGPVFEIHSPDVDAESVNRKVLERAAVSGKGDSERVASMSLSPLLSGRRGFDASATCELFDRPVPMPDFRSWKFRFIRGPLRPLALRVYKALSQIFSRMSENKAQAFYNAVYEVVDIRRENAELKNRIEQLEGRIEGLLSQRSSVQPALQPGQEKRPEVRPGMRQAAQNKPRPL